MKFTTQIKKFGTMTLAGIVLMGALAGCGGSGDGDAASTNGGSTASSSMSGTINVVSREDGSGTRGAFIELFGIQTKNGNEKIDNTTVDAIIANQTEVMMQNVAGDKNAIGYASLGSLHDSVKALKIDGAEATTDNVINGSYKVSRPFNIATKADLSAPAQDFINFILSADGQNVVSETGYIAVDDAAQAFTSDGSSGDITVAGSSSVTPVMEKLKEAYEAINTNVNITIQESDSTTGMTNAVEGICDIGMASRELSEEELQTLTPTQIALDGIAVIVNLENPVSDLSTQQVCSIFIGETTDWNEIG